MTVPIWLVCLLGDSRVPSFSKKFPASPCLRVAFRAVAPVTESQASTHPIGYPSGGGKCMTGKHPAAKMSTGFRLRDLLAMSFHVFLSHSSADKPAVEQLARRLAKQGIQGFAAFAVLSPAPALDRHFTKASVHIEGCVFSMWAMLPFSSVAKLWFNGF